MIAVNTGGCATVAEKIPLAPKPLKIRVFQKKVPPVFITGKIREL